MATSPDSSLELLLNTELYTPARVGPAHLLIAAGRIVWIGTERLTLPASLGARVRDLGSRRVIPGLIDGHAYEAIALSARGVTIDVTSFPVADGEDAWSASDALARYWKAGHPVDRITVSSDGGGCLPTFDTHGRVASMDVGDPGSLAQVLAELLESGVALERALPPFTSNVAALLRLDAKGHLSVGADADLAVLDGQGRITDVMAGGRWHVVDGTAVIHGTFEGARS